jgi:hypothetical protein
MSELNIFDAVADKKNKRNDIAVIYEALMRRHFTKVERYDWEAVNKAIIERWSVSGLIYIKERAWKLLDKGNQQRELERAAEAKSRAEIWEPTA